MESDAKLEELGKRDQVQKSHDSNDVGSRSFHDGQTHIKKEEEQNQIGSSRG